MFDRNGVNVFGAMAASLMLLAAAPAGAQSAARFEAPQPINIPAGSLSTALDRLIDQAGRQIIYAPALTEGMKVEALSGELTFREALNRLLENSGLTVNVVNEKTVVLKRADPATSQASPADQMRLASMADAAVPAQGGDTESERADVVVESQRDRPAPFSTANLDLTRTEDDALPFTVFDARDIELSGAADLQDFLQSRLPQNFTSDVFGETHSTTALATGSVDLRGWGAGETLFLLNGRRMPAHYQGRDSDAANATPSLQGIPLGSIERIEILSSAGSAIYGVSATGGVINIITRRDFRGGQVAVNYETPSDSHAPRRGVNASYGLPLKWGLGLRFGASYSDSEPLRVADRAAVSIERWRRLVMEREPARLIDRVSGDPFLTSSGVFGATPNIRAATTTGNLFSALPGAQASNYTTVPAGATGDSPLSAYQPGVYNVELAEGSTGGLSLYARDSTLGTVNSNRTLSLGMDKDFGELWQWSLDARHTETQSAGGPGGALYFSSSSPLTNAPRVPAEAPTNPFGQSVQVVLIDPNMDRPELNTRNRNATWELSSTLRGAVGQWHGFLDVSYAHHRHRMTAGGNFHEPHGGWNEAFLSGAYNPFVDPRVTAPAAPGFYEQYIARRGLFSSVTRTYQSALKASGPLLKLPAGAIQLTWGVEASRTDRQRSDWFYQFQDGLTGQPMVPVGRTSDYDFPLDANPSRGFVFDSRAGYAEATVPLLSSAQNVPLVQRLELFGSARVDSMTRNGFRSQGIPDQQAGVAPVPVRYTTTTRLHAVGLRFAPVEGVTFRATRSVGFRPPSISEITPAASPPTATTTGLNDPRREDWNGVLTPSMYVTGGNPDLKPETTESTNFGLVFAPRGGLRVSVDYLQSIRNDAIFSLGAQDAINLEGEKPGVVQRGAPDGHPSGVGPITFVDRRQINLREIASKSVDVTAEQRLENIGGGQLVLGAAVTRNLSFKVQTTNTGAAVEQVRNPAGAFSQQIAWNGNAQLRWEGPRWGVGWNVRYYDYVLLPQPGANPAQWFLLQGGDRAPRAFNHDLNASYRAPASEGSRGMQGLLSGTSLTFGIRNVFDRAPRFWAPGTDRGIAPYDSINGRSVWMQMRKDFQ